MKKLRTIDLSYGAVFIGLMAIGANISTWLPFLSIPIGGTMVPVSLQTFFAILAGLLLGSRLGAFSMLAYLLVGVAGVPVFAHMKSGLFEIVGNTGGFLISFVFVAWIAGKVVEWRKNEDKSTLFLASLAGLIMNYGIGTNFMYIALNTWLDVNISFSAAWIAMGPFFVKDFALAILIAAFLPSFITRLRQATSLPQFYTKAS